MKGSEWRYTGVFTVLRASEGRMLSHKQEMCIAPLKTITHDGD